VFARIVGVYNLIFAVYFPCLDVEHPYIM
jgi:hypothetical protein